MSKVLTRIDGRVLTLTLNRPEVMNALDSETHRLMADALDAYAANPELWLCVVRGAGGKAFCAGGDLAAMHAAANGGEPYLVPDSGYGGLTHRFDLDKPVIAVVDGLALGGGFEIALACDLVLASSRARFGLPEPKVGVVAYAGGMHRLPRQIGLKRAMQLLLTGDTLDAETALAWGLVNEVVAPDALEDALARWVAKLTACAPLSVRATKACVADGLALPLAVALARQDGGQIPQLEAMRTSRDVLEGIAAFNQKRPPQWQGR